MRFQLGSATLLVCVLVGCGRTPPPLQTDSQPTEATIKEDAPPDQLAAIPEQQDAGIVEKEHEDRQLGELTDTPTPTQPPDEVLSAEVLPDEESAVAPLHAEDSDGELQPDPELAEEIESAYMLWLPTSAGPLLIGLDVLIDDQPLRDAFEQKVAAIRSSTGVPVDGTLSWDALFEKVRSDTATFGQSSARLAGQEKGLITRFDRDKNDSVNDEEFLKFLFRDSDVSGEFRLFGTDAFRWSNRSASPVFAAIDQNQDSKLDLTEIDSASVSLLRQLDKNADECIDVSEATRPSDVDSDAWNRTRSNRHGNVAMDLSGFVSWSDLSYVMGGMAKKEPLYVNSNPVSMIDGNQDDWISAAEAEAVLDVAPAFHVVVRFNSSDPSASTLDVTIVDAESDIAAIKHGNRSSWISGGPLLLGIVVQDTPATQNRIPRQVFAQLDADKSGSIEQDEIPDGAEDQFPFESLDVNQDGKLSFMEINAALKQPESIWNFQVRARAGEHPDAVFAWLDQDHDQFLSSREVRSATDRLRSLIDPLPVIKATDIPDTLMIQFGRGEPDQDNARFAIERLERSEADPRPGWAQRMDANHDGEISKNEFIGPIDTFRQIDADGDQFLSGSEIAAVE